MSSPRAVARQAEARPALRFTDRKHLQNSDVSWGHEPRIPLTRPPATLSPIGGEGRGEGGWFMESEHLQFWTHLETMNGGARLRRALISQRHKLGLDGVSPHPGSHGKLIQPGQICAYATQICPIDSWFMGSEHLQNSDVNRSHEPGRRLQSGTGFQPVSPEQAGCLCHFLRFMERVLCRPVRGGRRHAPRLNTGLDALR